MTKSPIPEPDDKEQSQRFVDTAKELGVDESGKTFDDVMNKVITPKNSTSTKSQESS